MYVPNSLWPEIKKGLLDIHKQMKVGDVSVESNLISALSKSYIDGILSLVEIVNLNCHKRKEYSGCYHKHIAEQTVWCLEFNEYLESV